MKPLCFVLMPFGRKLASDGRIVDFDSVYEKLISPAIADAGLEPLRADQEFSGGIIHKPMFERLILCEYAIADLTTANANVFYELGLRHAVRPWATQLVFAEGWGRLPFDVAFVRALPYSLDDSGIPNNVACDTKALSEKLKVAHKAGTDSPVFQLVEGFPDPSARNAASFQEQIRFSEGIKARLADARQAGLTAVNGVAAEIGDIAHANTELVLDLLRTYRALSEWQSIVDLVGQMSPPLATTALVQEQLGLALNRLGKGEEAENVLETLIQRQGGSSESYGLLGRVYKDRWDAARQVGQSVRAAGLLEKAIRAYQKGFEADSRDAYPGVNAISLMEHQQPVSSKQKELLPVVSYAVEMVISHGRPDYWAYATRLEVAVLASDRERAGASLASALAESSEPWQRETTARNLGLIIDARIARGEITDWIDQLRTELTK